MFEFDHDMLGRVKVGDANIAVVDVVGSIGLAYAMSYFFDENSIFSKPYVTVPATFVIGAMTHKILKVKTELN